MIDEMSAAMHNGLDVSTTTTIGAVSEHKECTAVTVDDFQLSSAQLDEFFNFALPIPSSNASSCISAPDSLVI